MNPFKKISVLFFILFSCQSQKSESLEAVVSDSIGNNNIPKFDYLIYDDSLALNLEKDTLNLSYKFNTDTSGNFLKSIFVYLDRVKVQEIIVGRVIEKKEFRLIDWNFDGYKDITVLDNCGSGGCAYLIWNYSPKNGKYNYNERLSEVLGLEIDDMSKYIVFHYREGYPAEYWDTFEYRNDTLLFVKGLFQQRYNDASGNSWIKKTRTKIINKKAILDIDSSIVNE